MSWAGGDTWTGSYTFPDAPNAGGRYLMNITGTVKQGNGNNCNNTQNFTALNGVAGAYVDDANSDFVQYLKLNNMTPGLPTTDGNSYPKNNSVQTQVTVAFSPPLRDIPLSPQEPPIKLRFGTGPSQTQALDCGIGAGPNGWRGRMVTGCDKFSVNMRNGGVHDAVPGSQRTRLHRLRERELQQQGRPGRVREPVHAELLGRRHLSVEHPSGGGPDPRWIPLFILDQNAFTSPGKEDVPDSSIRRLLRHRRRRHGLPRGRSPGTAPGNVKRTELWGHFVTYVSGAFGDTDPGAPCPFTNADLCIPSWSNNGRGDCSAV